MSRLFGERDDVEGVRLAKRNNVGDFVRKADSSECLAFLSKALTGSYLVQNTIAFTSSLVIYFWNLKNANVVLSRGRHICFGRKILEPPHVIVDGHWDLHVLADNVNGVVANDGSLQASHRSRNGLSTCQHCKPHQIRPLNASTPLFNKIPSLRGKDEHLVGSVDMAP